MQRIEIKERNLADAESTAKYLTTQYQTKLADLENRKQELDKLEAQLKVHQHEINQLESQKLVLEQERANLAEDRQKLADSKIQQQNQLRSLQEQLDKSKAELANRQRFLAGLSEELDQQQQQLSELRSQLALQQERNRVKEQELEKRRGDFEQDKQSYEEAIRRAEEAKVELHIIKEVEKRLKEESRPLLEGLEKQRLDLEAQKEEFQVQLTQKQIEQQEFALRTEHIAQLLEQQAQEDEQAASAALAEVEDAKKQVLEEVQEVLDRQHKDHERQLHLHKRALLLARAELSRAIQYDRINGTSKWDLLGDKVGEVLKMHGIYAKQPIAREVSHGFEYSFLVLPLRVVPPERQVKGKEIPVHPISEGEAADIIARKNVLVDIVSAIPGASLKKLAIDVMNGRIKLIVNTSGADWDDESFDRQQDKEAFIIEPPANYVERIAQDSIHIKICGFSQSGKSTLGNNLVCTQKGLIEAQGKKAKITIIDPKPITEWDLPVQYEGLDKAMEGLLALDAEITRRIDYVKERKRQGIPRSVILEELHSDISIWLIDEADDVVSEWDDNAELVEELYGIKQKRPASKRIKRGIKVGAALGVVIDLIGQSPLPDDLHMRRNDLNHFTNVYIGFKTIPVGIEDCVFSKLESGDLYTQLNLRRIREQLQEEREIQTGEKPDRYALFALNTGKTFLATLPRPGECIQKYTGQEIGVVSTSIGDELRSSEGDTGGASTSTPPSMELLKANLSKSLRNSPSSHYKVGRDWKKPEIPCTYEGEITQVERDWACWLWWHQGVKNKKVFFEEIWGIKSAHKHKDYAVLQDRLKLIADQEGLGLKWRN